MDFDFIKKIELFNKICKSCNLEKAAYYDKFFDIINNCYSTKSCSFSSDLEQHDVLKEDFNKFIWLNRCKRLKKVFYAKIMARRKPISGLLMHHNVFYLAIIVSVVIQNNDMFFKKFIQCHVDKMLQYIHDYFAYYYESECVTIFHIADVFLSFLDGNIC